MNENFGEYFKNREYRSQPAFVPEAVKQMWSSLPTIKESSQNKFCSIFLREEFRYIYCDIGAKENRQIRVLVL